MSQRFLDGLEQRAAERLPGPVMRYLRQGARDGTSAAEAVMAWDGFRFLPRVLQDVSEVRLDGSLLGEPVRTPFGVAPTTEGARGSDVIIEGITHGVTVTLNGFTQS